MLVSVSKRNHNGPTCKPVETPDTGGLPPEPESPREISGGGRFNLGLLYVSKEIADYTSIENAVQKIIRNLSERI